MGDVESLETLAGEPGAVENAESILNFHQNNPKFQEQDSVFPDARCRGGQGLLKCLAKKAAQKKKE